MPCFLNLGKDWGTYIEGEEEVASMITVRVLVAVLPQVSVAT
jgi:hypothetical protein